jgi:hypothetical protein
MTDFFQNLFGPTAIPKRDMISLKLSEIRYFKIGFTVKPFF